jgi:hypothetical protein
MLLSSRIKAYPFGETRQLAFILQVQIFPRAAALRDLSARRLDSSFFSNVADRTRPWRSGSLSPR